MWWFTLLSLAAFAEAAPQAGGLGGGTLLRFGCSQITIERLDPLVNPGQVGTPHIHQVVGGNAFNATMPLTDVSTLASCTTCSFVDDLSNYWTANLYYQGRNGSYKRVPQIGNRLLFNDRFTPATNGGVTVYYVSNGPKKVTAFKNGFRMLFGDANRRAKQGNGMKSQSCFRCFTGPNFQGDNASPCADPRLDTETFPATTCPGGIRSNIHFPTCWDGKNMDSPNHQDHVAYPSTGPVGFTARAACPATHPVQIPQLMLEIVWDTRGFNDKGDWPLDGSQPFLLSTGDRSGYGQHADYVFGWKGDALQRAMDTQGCLGASCAGLKTQSVDVAKSCTIPLTVREDTEGWLPQLPGLMPMK